MGGDVDWMLLREGMKSVARRGGETSGRTSRRLGVLRWEVVMGLSMDKKVRSVVKMLKSEDVKMFVCWLLCLVLMFARSSEKKDGSEVLVAMKLMMKLVCKS